jgi:hypothetical protein
MTIQGNAIATIEPYKLISMHGCHPSQFDINLLEEELGQLSTKLKTTLIPEGNKYSHLATVRLLDNYHLITGDHTFMYNRPKKPTTYSTTITPMKPRSSEEKLPTKSKSITTKCSLVLKLHS